jgi:hypothetical protein
MLPRSYFLPAVTAANVESDNFDPVRYWAHGVQLVAMNMQTPDDHLQRYRAMVRAMLCRSIARSIRIFNTLGIWVGLFVPAVSASWLPGLH